MPHPITVYAPNIARRTERREHILAQFAGRPEFDLHVVPAIEQKNGPWALWQTFHRIVREESEKGSDFFIFCEDDHTFTEHYTPNLLMARIAEADALGADILSGGMTVVNVPVQVSPGLFWVGAFNGMQFTVIFRRAYAAILAARTDEGYVTDIQLSYLLKNKFVMFPYISVQKEFGYSDATDGNDEAGKITRYFRLTQEDLAKFDRTRNFYAQFDRTVLEQILSMDVGKVFLPVHAINLKARTDRLAHIKAQFEGHDEFRLHIVEACEEADGALGLWKSICRIVEQAKGEDEDFVLICEDDHIFTRHYDRDRFLRQIMLAGAMGAQLLSGGIGGFGNLVPLPADLHWVDWLWCTQFIVVYKNAYDLILGASFGPRDVADGKLSEILTAKMVVAPFVSEQTDFGYSDITAANNREGTILHHFDESRQKLAHYLYAESHFLGVRLPSDVLPPRAIPVSDYLRRENPHLLQIGCEQNLVEGWLNTDVEPTYGATFLDATQPFPMPDGCMDCVLAEHLIDALPLNRVERVLGECLRVLSPGGTLRLTVYTAVRLIQAAASGQPDEDMRRYAKWNIAHYSTEMPKADAVRRGERTEPLALFLFMRHMKNAYLYNFGLLSAVLQAAGFSAVTRVPLGQSTHPALSGVERHKPYKPAFAYETEAMAIEATKPS